MEDLNVWLEEIMQAADHMIGPKPFGKGAGYLTDPANQWDPDRSQGTNRPHVMETWH